MLTLSFGFKKPQTGDKGSVFWPALELNFQKLNDHDHNGTNSKKIPASSVEIVTQAVSSAGWVDQGSGLYRQLVTMPGTMTFDTQQIGFRDAASPNSPLYLGYEKVSANTYYVYINDNTISLTVIYS